MRSIATDAMRLATSVARSTSPLVGAPKLVPFRAVSMIESTTAVWACPTISGPQEETQSMYSLPSTSKILDPSPRAMKIGSRPIDCIARTGELTPPGSTSSARSYSCAEREVRWSRGERQTPACRRSQAR